MTEVEVGRIIYLISGIASFLIGAFNITFSIVDRNIKLTIIWVLFIIMGIILLLLFLSTFGTLVW